MTSNNIQPQEEAASMNPSNQLEENNSNLPQPTSSASTSDIPSFGWSQYAERVNGRFAMVGFLAILLIEALSNGNFLQWAGFIS